METNEKRNGKPSEKLNGFLKKSAGIQSEKPSEKLNVFFYVLIPPLKNPHMFSIRFSIRFFSPVPRAVSRAVLGVELWVIVGVRRGVRIGGSSWGPSWGFVVLGQTWGPAQQADRQAERSQTGWGTGCEPDAAAIRRPSCEQNERLA
jgi:hypothetical protein